MSVKHIKIKPVFECFLSKYKSYNRLMKIYPQMRGETQIVQLL
jgi:hypothetical protein